MAKRKTRAGANIPANETKGDRFVRVVTPRVGKALKAIRTVGFCTGSTYEYTPKQMTDIINALKTAVDSLSDNFAKKSETTSEFSFTE